MLSNFAISDCDNHCSHFYICKYQEDYKKAVEGVTLDVQYSFNKKFPDFIDAGATVKTAGSALCKYQDFAGKYAPKYIRTGYHSCDTCKRKDVCKYSEKYLELSKSAESNYSDIAFELRCPYFLRIPEEQNAPKD